VRALIIILTLSIPSVVTAVRSVSLIGGVAKGGYWVTPFGIATMGLSLPQ